MRRRARISSPPARRRGSAPPRACIRAPKARDGKPLFLDTAIIGERDAEKRAAADLRHAWRGGLFRLRRADRDCCARDACTRPRAPRSCCCTRSILTALPGTGASTRTMPTSTATSSISRTRRANRAYAELADADLAEGHVARRDEGGEREASRLSRRSTATSRCRKRSAKGQYKYPDGVYYGGAKESWSAAMLRDVFARGIAAIVKKLIVDRLPHRPRRARSRRDDQRGPAGLGRLSRAPRRCGASACARARRASRSRAPLTGTIDKAVPELAARRPKLTFAALEVGTRPTRDVFNALRRDNWLHCFARRGPSRMPRRSACEIRDAFYPDTAEWKRMVWNAANEVVQRRGAARAI